MQIMEYEEDVAIMTVCLIGCYTGQMNEFIFDSKSENREEKIMDYQEKIVGLYYHILEEMKLSPSLRFDIAISYATYMYYHLDFHRCYQYLHELHEEYGGRTKHIRLIFFSASYMRLISMIIHIITWNLH